MKPGTSCRNTSGMLNASHSHTNRAALSAAFTSSAPPSTIGWLATMPTGCAADARRARSRCSSPTPASSRSTSPSSTIACDDLAHVVRAARRGRHDVVELLDPAVDGIVASRAPAAARRLCCGKNDEVLAHDREALGVVGDLEVGDAEIFVCTAEPPISSSVTSSPTAAFTRCRPPSAIDDVPFTIGTKSASAGMYAVPAAQWPSIAATIGTTPLIATCSRNSVAGARERRAARRLDARAGRVEQPHHRDALAQRVRRACGAILFSPTAAHRAGHHGEVVRRDRDRPAVDLADAGDRAVGREVAVAEARRPCGRRAARTRPTCPDRAAGRAARGRSACRASAAARRDRRRPCRARAPCAARGRRRAAPSRARLRPLRRPLGSSSSALPLRRALLGERGDALGRVLGLRRDRQHRLQVRRARRRRPSRAPGRTSRGPSCMIERRLRRERRPRARRPSRRARRPARRACTKPMRSAFVGVDPPAGHHQLERLLRRHRAQQRHRDHVRPQPDVDLGRAELARRRPRRRGRTRSASPNPPASA